MRKMTLKEVEFKINRMSNLFFKKQNFDLAATVEEESCFLGGIPLKGRLRVEVITDEFIFGPVGDFILNFVYDLPLRFVCSDESSRVAWYELSYH